MNTETKMTDERALADEYRPSMTLEVLHAWAAEAVARLRGEAAPENVAEDSYHFMADLLAPHVTDTHGGLPGSVVESFQMLLEHWNRTHTAQGEQQAVALDGCTESNCPRCLTHPDHRGDMAHAGIGHYPQPATPAPVAGDAVRVRLNKVIEACSVLSSRLGDGPNGDLLSTISVQAGLARDALAQDRASQPEATSAPAMLAEGVVTFMRGETDTCVCCPGMHVFCRYVDWEIDGKRNDADGLMDELRERVLNHNENEGKRVRVTVEVLAAAPKPTAGEVRSA